MAAGRGTAGAPPKQYPRRYRGILRDVARRQHIPARILAAQEFIESGYAEDVIAGRRKSSAGAYGISQFIASTGRQYGVRAGTAKDAVRTQIEGHAKYLNALGFQHNRRGAIASYAGGPGNPQAWYAAKVLGLAPKYRGIGSGPGSRGGSKATGSRRRGVNGAVLTTAQVVPAGLQQGTTGLAALLQGQASRQAVSVSAPPDPAFSARKSLALPAGYAQTPPSGGGQVEAPESLSDQLRAIHEAVVSQPGVPSPSLKTNTTVIPGRPGSTGSNGSGGSGGGKILKGGGHYPLGKRGKVIGVPYQGTHNLGDWESDNAVDIAVPTGTPVRAVVDGVIGSQIGSLGRGGRFAGLRVHLAGHGNEWYYAHLSRLTVKAGQRVKKGQIIGYSGSANGVQHLHWGQKHGDPRRTLGRK